MTEFNSPMLSNRYTYELNYPAKTASIHRMSPGCTRRRLQHYEVVMPSTAINMASIRGPALVVIAIIYLGIVIACVRITFSHLSMHIQRTITGFNITTPILVMKQFDTC